MISLVRGKDVGGLLTLEVHSPKSHHELSCVKMLVQEAGAQSSSDSNLVLT